MEESKNPITSTVCPQRSRMRFMSEVAGHFCVALEGAIFDAMAELSSDYSGGSWQLHKTSNDGFFMTPPDDGPMTLLCAGNGFEGVMSSEAAGVVASLAGINRMAWKTRQDRFSDLYHRLRAFALAHPESTLIMAAID